MGRGHENKLESGRFWLGIRKACAFSFNKKYVKFSSGTSVQRHCRLFTWSYSIIQDSIGQSLDQHNLVCPAFGCEFTLGDLQNSLPVYMVLWVGVGGIRARGCGVRGKALELRSGIKVQGGISERFVL